MKIKFFLIYVFVGIAFLGVSAWVFLSGGQNAKAIRAKYRLGGILIMAWAMISVASCSAIEGLIDGRGMVTCYDAVAPEPTEDIIQYSFKKADLSPASREICPGDIICVNITAPSSNKYVLLVQHYDSEMQKNIELQSSVLVLEKQEDSQFEVVLSEDISYKGAAELILMTVVQEDPEEYGPYNYTAYTTIDIL